MTMTPEELLAGPRGRRLCLEWARMCEGLALGEEKDHPLDLALLGCAVAADTPGRLVVAVERQ